VNEGLLQLNQGAARNVGAFKIGMLLMVKQPFHEGPIVYTLILYRYIILTELDSDWLLSFLYFIN